MANCTSTLTLPNPSLTALFYEIRLFSIKKMIYFDVFLLKYCVTLNFDSFNRPRRFFSFFPQWGSFSLATSYISLNTPAFMHAYECTFALGGISIPCSLFTSHFSLAFKCEPSVTRVSNCLSVLVVITNFKAVIYITRGSTVSFNLNRKKNLFTDTAAN